MAVREKILTTLLKHGPLSMSELLDVVDPDRQETFWSDDLMTVVETVPAVAWRMIDRGELVWMHDRRLRVSKGDCS